MVALVVVAIVCFNVAGREYYTTLTYVPAYCSVKNLLLKNCSSTYTTDQSILRRCFLPVWLIEYKDSGKNKQATIIGQESVKEYDDDNHTSISKLYEIGGTYRCYRSDYLEKVQWHEPSFLRFIALITCGIFSTLVVIGSLVFRLRNRRRPNNIHQNGRNENDQPASAAPIARRPRVEGIPLTPPLPNTHRTVPAEEDALVTPPPPYTPSIASTDEETNPTTPPPPYTPLIIHSEEEQVNNPITPPPAYTSR